MIFTNNINDIINIDKDSFYFKKDYSNTKLYKYYNSLISGFEGKRVLINQNNKIETGNSVLHRDQGFSNKMNPYIYRIKERDSLIIDNLFVFTDDYGDRNICHWMTEQLLVLNYLIDILNTLNDYKTSNDSSIDEYKVYVLINKNPRNSMFQLIRDYLSKIPLLESTNILEVDLQTGELYNYDNNNCVYNSINKFSILSKNIFVGNSISNNLSSLYSGWNFLHNRLSISNITELNYNNYTTPLSNFKNFYMSRRNLLDPSKKTNTRVMENLVEVSDIICLKNYIEVFTDELNSLDDRINLFKKAKNIICELGAGMHNLLYCSEGINVYVMFQKNNYSWLQEYFPLFQNKKMKVTLLVGETTNDQHNGNWLNTPWKLDVFELNKIPNAV
jgi:hypothetical protein